MHTHPEASMIPRVTWGTSELSRAASCMCLGHLESLSLWGTWRSSEVCCIGNHPGGPNHPNAQVQAQRVGVGRSKEGKHNRKRFPYPWGRWS